jgi:hypothetical protein
LSLALADYIVDHLMDKFGQYLIYKKVKTMIVPYVTTEVFGIALGTCEYLNIQRDVQKFDFDEDSETKESLSSEVDRCTGGDYMKKNMRYLEEPVLDLEPSLKEHSVTTSRTGTGARRLRKAVNKMSLALIGSGNKKK